jgi:uncharacterized protein
MSATRDPVTTRFGIGFRHELARDTLNSLAAFDCLEIVTDQFVHRSKDTLARLARDLPVIPHGVGMSLGSVSPPDRDYLKALKQICRIVDAPFYGEHLSLNMAAGIDVGHLAPVPINDRAFDIVERNVRVVQDFLGVPLCIENITYGFSIGQSDRGLEQADLLRRLVDRTGCLLLLDVANLHINATNHGFAPDEFVCRLPKHAVAQVHLAGGIRQRNGRLIDSHNSAIQKDVWALFESLMRDIRPRYVIIERDSDFPPIEELIAEVDEARNLSRVGEYA